MITSTLTADLIAARKLIENPFNWIKGGFDNLNNCYCTIGAIEKIKDNHYFYLPELIGALTGALPYNLPEECGDVWDSVRDKAHIIFRYNDAKTTTHADILSLFDRAIENSRLTSSH